MFRVSYPHLLELKVLDWKFKIKQQYQSYTNEGQITIKKAKVIIVTLNDDFLDDDLISRRKLAELLTLVSTKNPKVIGLDVLLDKSREGDDTLADAIKSAGNVVLPFELISRQFGGNPLTCLFLVRNSPNLARSDLQISASIPLMGSYVNCAPYE